MKRQFLFSLMVSCAFSHGIAQRSIEPLVEASWNQSQPFNLECPDDAVAGCGAIAVAQILNYYKMPAHGFGHSIYDKVNVDFDNRKIDWAKIRNNYSQNEYTDEEEKAVAGLVYQVGAAMKMKYGSSSSPYNYPSMMWGLQHHLHFSPLSRYRHRHYYSTAEWIEMLNQELEKGHPVFYRGDHTQQGKGMVGHMYVIDGRDSEGRYHFNFGHASKLQDKFTDLNIINQGNGVWPGIYSVSYHHRQAMVTDFYPVDGLKDEDYDHTALVLNSALVLDGHPHTKVIKKNGRVQAKFQVRFVNFFGGSCQLSLGFYQQGELKAVSKTVRNLSFTDGGYTVNIDRVFTLPDNLSDGDYEMSIISRDDADSPWVRGWDNAPNCVPVSVKSNLYTFTVPNYHTLETNLYLGDDGIHEVLDVAADGKVLEMTVRNLSDNNFEDSLRVVVSSKGKKYKYEMPTSIYSGQEITYRFLAGDISSNDDYDVEAYYKEVNTSEWIRLTDQASSVYALERTDFDGVKIYSVDGKLLKSIARQEIESNYAYILSHLPKGIYVVHDNNGTRKFVKQR